METELKLRFVQPDGQEQLLASAWFHQLVMSDSPAETDMLSRYYDTADLALTQMKTSLRIRQEGEAKSITIKLGGQAANGLHQRLEWSVRLSDADRPTEPEEGLDIGWFQKNAVSDGDPDDQLREILRVIDGHPLTEICQASFVRLAYDVGYGDTLMEMDLDRGEIRAGDLTDSINELELELKEGDVRDLMALGAELASLYGLVPESKSKYSRCLDLLRQQGHPDGD
jgi:triphosphatase